MIYTCSNCFWRINERTNNKWGTPYKIKEPDDPSIGKYITYEHKAFCSGYCVNEWKCKKTKPKYVLKSSDWFEDEWKMERKINRPKRLKQKKI